VRWLNLAHGLGSPERLLWRALLRDGFGCLSFRFGSQGNPNDAVIVVIE
jgi:hypothetical protein